MFLGTAHNLALGFKFPIFWKRKWKSVEVLLFTLVHDVTLYQPLLIIIIWTFFVVFFFLFFFFKCLVGWDAWLHLKCDFLLRLGKRKNPFSCSCSLFYATFLLVRFYWIFFFLISATLYPPPVDQIIHFSFQFEVFPTQILYYLLGSSLI